MPRILPVRERAIRAYVAGLKEIRIVNGYNTEVRHVRRSWAPIVDRADDPPEIQIRIDKSNSKTRSSAGLKWTILPVSNYFYARGSAAEPDTDYIMFLADIQRRFAQPFPDNSSVALGGKGWLVEVKSDFTDQPFYWEGKEGAIVGVIESTLAFTWCGEDPRKWGAGDVHVPE